MIPPHPRTTENTTGSRPPLRRPGATALCLIMLLAAGCNEPNKTDGSTSGSAGATSTANPNDPNIDALAQQAEQYAQTRADGNRAARDNDDVQWLNPGSPSPAPNTATPNDAVARAPQSTSPRRGQPLVQPQPHNTTPTPARSSNPTPAPAPNNAASEDTSSSKPTRRPLRSTEALIDSLSQALKRDAHADNSLRPWLARAALAVVDPRHELTEDELTSLDASDREVVLAYQRTFAEMGQALGQDARSDRQLLQNLADQLAEQVADTRSLRIRNLKLCKRVKGFGVYETFGRNVFLAGRTQPMIVYAELENFKTKTNSDGAHVARLTQEIVLYNQTDGLPVWRQRPVKITDESQNHRRDFFVVQVIRLSDRLTVGKYLLKVSITDEIGQTMDEATMPIEIVADPQLVERP